MTDAILALFALIGFFGVYAWTWSRLAAQFKRLGRSYPVAHLLGFLLGAFPATLGLLALVLTVRPEGRPYSLVGAVLGWVLLYFSIRRIRRWTATRVLSNHILRFFPVNRRSA